MSDLAFLQTLIIGSYVWTLTVGVGLWKLIERRFTALAENHLHHLEAEVKRLAARRSRVRQIHRSQIARDNLRKEL